MDLLAPPAAIEQYINDIFSRKNSVGTFLKDSLKKIVESH